MAIQPSYKSAVKPLLTGETPAFATTILSVLIQCYGVEVINFEGETIQMQLKDDFEIEMPRRVYDKLMALLAAITSTSFYSDVEAFHSVCAALTGHGLSGLSAPPSALDLAWAITEVHLADPEPVGLVKGHKWGSNIKAYLRAVLDDEGLDIAPKSLGMAKKKFVGVSDTDPDMMGAAVNSKQQQADMLDAQVGVLVSKLMDQLALLGIKPELTKQAEWTSPENEAVHMLKHAPEFGDEAGYAAAEKEHQVPAGDEVLKDIRCKPDATGQLKCTIAQHSPSRGTIHVKTLADGRTVTLYKLSK